MNSEAELAIKTPGPRDVENSTAPEACPGRFLADRLASHGVLLLQCVALALAYTAARECHGAVTQTAPAAPLLPSLIYGLVLWYWWGIAATVIWKLAEQSGKNFFAPASAAKHALLGVIFAGAHPWMLQQTVNWLMTKWPILGPAGYSSLNYLNFNRVCFELLLYGFIFGITGVFRLQLASQRDQMRSLSLEKQLSVAHLRALQMQLEPHFLFNTLNAITSLVEVDHKEEALGTLSHLNLILKSTLRRHTPEKVPLSEELELVDHYLSIEETRFADRLQVKMIVDPSALGGLVPCFLLQPIVENAIRHGIARCEESGVVAVIIDRSGDSLHMTVRDSGPGIDGTTQPGHGIGLKNTRERLHHFYGSNSKLVIGTPESGGFEVLIEIPFESAD